MTPYLSAITEFIKDLDRDNKLILNHSCCQYLLGILLNYTKYRNVKILTDIPKSLNDLSINSLIKNKLCFGLYNKTKRLYEKTTSILICVYCYSVVNIAFKSKNEPNKAASLNDLENGYVIGEYKNIEEEDIFGWENSEEAQNKKRRVGAEKITVKRNIVKTKTYTDNLDPTLVLHCREKHKRVHVVNLHSYTSRGRFVKRQVIWGINKTTAYWIQLSDDFDAINIYHHKKNTFTLVCTLNIHAAFQKDASCERLLVSNNCDKEKEGDRLFEQRACDFCYMRHKCLRKKITKMKTKKPLKSLCRKVSSYTTTGSRRSNLRDNCGVVNNVDIWEIISTLRWMYLTYTSVNRNKFV